MNPLVSIIIPCYNEATTIHYLLEAIAHQSYPCARLEVIIADGLSTDKTRDEIGKFQREYPDLSLVVVDNHKKIIPAALNTAISVAKGSIFLRLDAHSIPQSDYVERSVNDLELGLGDNVGGVWEMRPGSSGWISQVIAAVAAHPLGVGDAQYRFTNRAASVDTVPFGAFKRELVARIGGFDESLQVNEDYEFNARIRQAGGSIWLDPSIRSTYFTRPSLGALAKQYWRYGYWKVRMLRRYPGTIRWRQALPPLFVSSLVMLGLLSIWFVIARYLLLAEIVAYLAVLGLVAGQIAIRQKKLAFLPGVPLAIATMHFSWASGFLWSLIFSR
jgi:succinoglycan biosynthesis protein ExoA